MFISAVLWADITNYFVWAIVIVTLGFGAIGFADDYLKVSKKNSKGLAGRYKLIWQLVILLGVSATTPRRRRNL